MVLGTGWGAAAFLKNIDTDKYDVTVISPRNYFVFTPMLAGASVGSVDFKSITEPIREVRLWMMCMLHTILGLHSFIGNCGSLRFQSASYCFIWRRVCWQIAYAL